MEMETPNKIEDGGSALRNPGEFLSIEHLKTDLKGRSVRGGAVTMASQGAQLAIRMASTMVLARLLTPQDYGLIGMVTVITGFILLFKDLGLSMATIQKAEINHAQISTLFWINVLLGTGVTLVTAALAPAIAWLYGEPRLTWITLAMSGAFVFGGLSVQHQALLRRQMHFGSLAFIQIFSLSFSILTAIIAAWYGAGYWALVIMDVVDAICGFVGVWVACGWRPGLPVRGSGVRTMLAFGGNLTGFNFLNYFARNADNLLIGKFWGANQLGLYSKAYSLLLLPLGQITYPISSVATPTLSRLQNDPDMYRRYYYRAMNIIAFTAIPLVGVFAALSEEILTLLLGSQWTDAAIIFKVLALAAVFQPIWSTIGWIYVSLGQTKRLMHWGLIMVPLIIISFLIGLPWGGLGVAISYTTCFLCLILIPSFWYAFRYSPVSTSGLFRAIQCPLTLGLIMYCAIELTRRYVDSHGLVLTVVYGCAAGICACFMGLVFWRRARNELFEVLGVLKHLRKTSTE